MHLNIDIVCQCSCLTIFLLSGTLCWWWCHLWKSLHSHAWYQYINDILMYLSGFRWYFNVIILHWVGCLSSGLFFYCTHIRSKTLFSYVDVFSCNRTVLNHGLAQQFFEFFNGWESYIVVYFYVSIGLVKLILSVICRKDLVVMKVINNIMS